MRTSAIAMIVALAACGSGESAKRPEVGSGSAQIVVEDKPRTGPHSGAIERIAITDDGKVAYSIDTFGQGRLWLALDGTREPIVARGGRALRTALGRTDEGFVAALLDEAGGLELVRFDRDGRTRGHIALAPEPGFKDVVAVADGVLARRRDEFLVWYDAGGKKRGQISAEPGERITGIAVRRGRVIASIVAGDERGISLRWVQLDKTLAWGDRQKLRGEVEAPIALSPDGTKIACIDSVKKRFEVVNLTTGEGMFAKSDDSTVVSDAPALGFLDDNTAVFSDARGTAWWALAMKDPWATSRRGAPSDTSDIAVGDHVMLDSSSTSLTLTDESSVKYLGYRDVGPSVLWSTTSGIATQRGTKSVWLDRDLRERVTHVAPTAQVSAIAGDHHLVISDAGRIYLYDAVTNEEKNFGRYDEAATVVYDPATAIVAISTQTRIDRFLVSAADIVPLQGIAVSNDHGPVKLVNPATSGGVIATVSTTGLTNIRVDWYRDGATGMIKPTASTSVDGEALPLSADQRGVLYFLDRVNDQLLVHELGKSARKVSLPITDMATAAVHPDGSLVIVATGSEIVAFDTGSGEQRWRLPVPGIDTLMFSVDGQTLFASAQGGLVSVEPRNGTRIATACGWNFGLHDDQVSAQVFGVPNLCAGLE